MTADQIGRKLREKARARAYKHGHSLKPFRKVGWGWTAQCRRCKFSVDVSPGETPDRQILGCSHPCMNPLKDGKDARATP